MSLELIAYKERTARGNLKEGEARLTGRAALYLRTADLPDPAGDRVALLIDRDTRRIALRAPRDDQRQSAAPVNKVGKYDTVSWVPLRSAFEELGVVPADNVGLHDLTTVDDLVILNLKQAPK